LIGRFVCSLKQYSNRCTYLRLFLQPFISVNLMSYCQLFVRRICRRLCDGLFDVSFCSWHYFANKRRSLGRHSSLADQSH
jgi:hypothetical protein